MSADNVIYVQKRKDKYYVWHDFMSNESSKPSKMASEFNSLGFAMVYAVGYMDGCGYVEGGIQVLPERLRK